MKKLFLATVALAALGTATSASAADLARRTYTKAPPMIAAVYDWSGFYIGGNGGYGSAGKCWDFIPSTVAGVPTGAANVGEGCHDADGGTAGGQIGYRWQNASWVYGLEAQGNWADFKGSNVSTQFPLIANRS